VADSGYLLFTDNEVAALATGGPQGTASPISFGDPTSTESRPPAHSAAYPGPTG